MASYAPGKVIAGFAALALLSACTGTSSPRGPSGVEPRSTANTTQTAAAPSTAADASHPPRLPRAFRGPFHAQIKSYDALTLDLEDDGTYRIALDGCHYSWSYSGIWRVAGSADLMLSSSNAEQPLHWIHDGGGIEVRGIRLDVIGEGIEASILGPLPEPEMQRWSPGRVCAVCGEPRGGFSYAVEPPVACQSTERTK